MTFDPFRDAARRQHQIERAPIPRQVNVGVRVTQPRPMEPEKKKPEPRPLRRQPMPFYMIVWDETNAGVAIVQSRGGAWQLLGRPTMPAVNEGSELSRDDHQYSYMHHLGRRHFLVKYYNGSLEELQPRWAILSSVDLRATEWTEDEDESQEPAGVDGNATEWWRQITPLGTTQDAQQSTDEGESWTTLGDLGEFGSGGDVAVHPTESVVAFLNYLGASAADSFTLYSDGTFSDEKFIADVEALGAELGPEGSNAGAGSSDRIGKFAWFTASGRLLMLQQIAADGGDVGLFNTEYLLLFRADAPYTSFNYTIVAGPHASGAWKEIDDVKDGQRGLALSRDSSRLFLYSNHSPDAANPEGPAASTAAAGHVYMSADDGETVTELTSPDGIVRGLFYYQPRNSLYAQMKDGSVLRMRAPGTEGATWVDATANLLTVLGSESVLPYVNNGIWA